MSLPGFPRYGFNFLWMYSPGEGRRPEPADPRALDFLARRGFDFVRVPTNYWFWTKAFDYDHPDETVLGMIDGYLEATSARGMHLSLNLHRAPGYCINSPERERHNLWTDAVAQDAFVATWERFARRYRGVPAGEAELRSPQRAAERGASAASHARSTKP